MSKRVKVSEEEKMYTVNQVLKGTTSRNTQAKRLGVHHNTIGDWIRKYEEGGSERLRKLRTWTRYSEETKRCAVHAVLQDGQSIQTVLEK